MTSIWNTITVASIKEDLQAIERATKQLTGNLKRSFSEAAAADFVRNASQTDAKDFKLMGKPLSADDKADAIALLQVLVATPFTKMNVRNARAKQMDMVSPDEAVRDAAGEARVAITGIKRAFFADETVYNAVAPVLKAFVKGDSKLNASFASGLLKKFHHIGLFALDDLKVRQAVQACMTEIAQLEKDWNKQLRDDVSKTSLRFKSKDLQGVPSAPLATMPFEDEGEKAKGEEGLRVVKLSYPHVTAVTKYCTIRDTRRLVHSAFVARGGAANEATLLKIAGLRLKAAKLQGQNNYADVVQSQNRMAGSSKRVLEFLQDLSTRTGAKAKEESARLAAFAKDALGLEPPLQPFDAAFVLDAMKSKVLALDSKVVNKFFPSKHVVPCVMNIYERLLSLQFIQTPTQDKWHADVEVWRVYDRKGAKEGADTKDLPFLGTFYLDLFPRDGKYGHACVVNLVDTPLGAKAVSENDSCAMLCNLSVDMSHSDVVTFMHEFGHVMHGICGKIGGKSPYAKVPRDFVEAPSQMLENWCWQENMLDVLSKHKETGESMPSDLKKRIKESRFFFGLRGLRRQLYLNAFDQLLHSAKPPSSVQEMAAREQEFRSLYCFDETELGYSGLGRNFGHTAAQYSASYYGYVWSEVFSADMFETCFSTPESLTDSGVGQKYRECILEPGGTETADSMLERFLGRPPKMDSFLRHYCGPQGKI